MATPIPRTTEDIISRIKALQTAGDYSDFFGVHRYRLSTAVPFEQASAAGLVKDGVTKEQWESDDFLRSVEDVKAMILSYLPFAWDKANGCRGISANRSLDHFRGLCWLLGSTGEAIIEHPSFGADYQFYGKPALELVSDLVGFDWRKVDNGRRVNSESEDESCLP